MKGYFSLHCERVEYEWQKTYMTATTIATMVMMMIMMVRIMAMMMVVGTLEAVGQAGDGLQ